MSATPITRYCPLCGTELVEGAPDGKGKPWYYCNDCEAFHHADTLDEIAAAKQNFQDAARAVDVMAEMDGLLPEFGAAVTHEQVCRQRMEDLITSMTPKAAGEVFTPFSPLTEGLSANIRPTSLAYHSESRSR